MQNVPHRHFQVQERQKQEQRQQEQQVQQLHGAHRAELTGLAQILLATLSHQNAERSAAEARLLMAVKEVGFSRLLLLLSLEVTAPLHVRQLAAVSLKRLVQKHWHQVVGEADKAFVRDFILLGLSDVSGKMRTAFGMGISAIAKNDWPEMWPSLMPSLLALTTGSQGPQGVSGAVRCLSLFVDYFDEVTLPQFAPQLFPELLRIMSQSTDATCKSFYYYSSAIRLRAATALKESLFLMGHTMAINADLSRLLVSFLPSWMEAFKRVLSHGINGDVSQQPLPEQFVLDPLECGIKAETIRMLTLLWSFAGNRLLRPSLTPFLPSMLSLVWALLSATTGPYQHFLVFAPTHVGASLSAAAATAARTADDPTAISSDAVGVQSMLGEALAFFQTAYEMPHSVAQRGGKVGHGQRQEEVEGTPPNDILSLQRLLLPALFPVILQLLQLSATAAEDFEVDPDSFVIAEEDDYAAANIRAGGTMLVEVNKEITHGVQHGLIKCAWCGWGGQE